MRRTIFLCILFLLVCHASAITKVQQGDIIYMNESYDITQAVSYPTYQIVWCAANNGDCDPPDQIIDTEKGNLENYSITEDNFRYGTYYRWDGEWHMAENSVAFTIIPGKRPKSAKNITIDAPAQIKKEPEGPFNYLVARGDTVTLSSRIYEPDNCHLWLFTNVDTTYDLQMIRVDDTCSVSLNDTTTHSMNVGKYSGYIQCDSKNNWQDVYYSDGALDTPYDDSIVKDVPVMQWNLLNTKRQFDALVSEIPKFDDTLIPVTLEVADPTSTIIDVQQDDYSLFISGVTTWSDGTSITLQLDPDQYPIERDLRLHTWQTFVNGSIDAPRTFNTALPFEKDELSIGPHEIVMKTDKNTNMAVSSYTFKVSDVMVMPAPTPEPKRMIYGKDWEEIPVKITPTPEPTVNVTPEVTIIPTVNVTVNITVNATPNATEKATVAPTANQTIPTIPTGIEIILAAVGVALVLRRES